MHNFIYTTHRTRLAILTTSSFSLSDDPGGGGPW